MHSHYRQSKIDALDVIKDWNLNFIEGNIIKYLQRHKLKNGQEDLTKCLWYICYLITEDRRRSDKIVELLLDGERWREHE